MSKIIDLDAKIFSVEQNHFLDLETSGFAKKLVDSRVSESSSPSPSPLGDPTPTLVGELDPNMASRIREHKAEDGDDSIKKGGTRSRASRRGSGSNQTMSDAGSNSTYMYSHEPFETFKLKIIQLCRDIAWGEPSEVEHLKGGGYHRIISVKFNSRQPQDYIFRIARQQEEEDLSEQIRDEVAIHGYLFQLLPVLKVVAFDGTRSNVLECSYVLQERITGKSHEATYYNLSLAEKLQITSKVAELILKMETIKFDKPGRLAAKSKKLVLRNPDKNDNSTNKDITIAGFREGKLATESNWPISGAHSFKELMIEHLVHQRSQATQASPPSVK